MIERILPLLNSLVPTGIAIKGLGRINPKLEKFASGAFGAGYTADQVLDFLRGHFQNEGNQGVRERLDQSALQGTARPDELAARKGIHQDQAIPNAISNALTGGAAIAGGIAGLGGEEQPAANIIAEHSPELHQFIEQQIQGGIPPIQAATMAYKNPNFTSPINQLEKATRRRLPEIVSSLYPTNAQPSRPPQAQQSSDLDPELVAILQDLHRATQ